MEKENTPKKIDRRKFLLQAGGGTLAVGFGAGLTSCGGGGGGQGSGPGRPLIDMRGSSFKLFGFDLNIEFNFGSGGNGNNNNNSGQISQTYDSLTDTYYVENISEEDVVLATYGIEEINGSPVELSDLEVILSPGQSFSYVETAESTGVITNTSSNDIQLGGSYVLEPEESLDFGV